MEGRLARSIAGSGTSFAVGPAMPSFPHLTDAGAFADADQLISTFGAEAATQAAARAERSRGLGNAVRFCHWRQIERLIDLLGAPGPIGTIH